MTAEPLVQHPAAERDADEVLPRLGNIDILRALPAEEIQEIIPWVEQLELPAGHCLMKQGERGDALYLIEEGSARVERSGVTDVARLGPGSVVGETALLTGEMRNATVTADTPLVTWRITKDAFDRIVASSPNLKQALHALVESRSKGYAAKLPSRQFWISTALRAVDARYRGLTVWQGLLALGLVIWVLMFLNGIWKVVDEEEHKVVFAAIELATGLLVLQGACEAFLQAVERLGARLRWDGFISGTVGSLISTLPEFVVIAFLVLVEPLAAFVTAVVTIFNNALAFSIYSFFLPKDRQGGYAMPNSLTNAGVEILVAGGATMFIVGTVMLLLRINGSKAAFTGIDLLVIGTVLFAIYAYYLHTLVRYYAKGEDDEESVPPDPGRLGHDTSWGGIASMFALGTIGAYCGGEAIGGFAETALKQLGWPTIPTAAALAFFAGISEYIIVYKSHRRGELGVALSNVFGGMTQVMFLLMPFGMIVIGILGLARGDPLYAVPINVATMMLVLLLFPLCYVLHQFIAQEKSLTDLDAAGMTGIYLLLLYFLFTSPV